jgi:hypothetical protein
MSARHRLASSTSGGPTHLDRRQGKAQPLPSCYATEYTGTGGYVPSFEANTTQGIGTIWLRKAPHNIQTERLDMAGLTCAGRA